jgi:hypothetical protein
MFAVYCPFEDARVLLGPSRIVAVERQAGGFGIRYRCWCGHEGVHTVERADAERTPAAAAVAAVEAPATPAAVPVAPAVVAAAVPVAAGC